MIGMNNQKTNPMTDQHKTNCPLHDRGMSDRPSHCTCSSLGEVHYADCASLAEPRPAEASNPPAGEPNPVRELAELLREGKIVAKFGLKAQGHIPTIENMLGENRPWSVIAREIGWTEDALKEHWIWHLDESIERLRAEVDELNAWKSGQKGIEDYYTLKADHQILADEAQKLGQMAGNYLQSLTSERERVKALEVIIKKINDENGKSPDMVNLDSIAIYCKEALKAGANP